MNNKKVSTGFENIDLITGGFDLGSVAVVTNTSTDRDVSEEFTASLCRHLAVGLRTPVCIIPFGMNGEYYVKRLIDNVLDEKSIEELSKAPVYFKETPVADVQYNTETVNTEILEAISGGKYRTVIIDLITDTEMLLITETMARALKGVAGAAEASGTTVYITGNHCMADLLEDESPVKIYLNRDVFGMTQAKIIMHGNVFRIRNVYEQPGDGGRGIFVIDAERRRQMSEEGWSAEHDRSHDRGQLANAGAAYAMTDSMKEALGIVSMDNVPACWPFDDTMYKPSPGNRIRDLAKAGALIAAEIDRLSGTPGN